MENAIFFETRLPDDTSRDMLSNIDDEFVKSHEPKSTNGNQKLEENFDFASDIIDLLLYVENDQTTRHNIESIIDQWDEMNILNEDGSKSIVNFETNTQIKIKNILHSDDVVSECADVCHYTITVQNNNTNHPSSNQSANLNEPTVFPNLTLPVPSIGLQSTIKRVDAVPNSLLCTERRIIDQTDQFTKSTVSSCPSANDVTSDSSASSSANTLQNNAIKSVNEDDNLTARIKALFCKTCDRNFDQLLCSGQIKKISSKPFPCPFCRGNYYHKSSADIHMKVHMQEDELKCRLCTNSMNNVVVRKTTTDETKPIEKRPKLNANCGLCSATFETQFELAKHVSVVHNKVTCRRLMARRSEICRCRTTDGRNLTETTAATYCNSCSLRKQRNFKCKNCGRRFGDQLNYNLHRAYCVASVIADEKKATDLVQQHRNIVDHNYGKPILEETEGVNDYGMVVDGKEKEIGSNTSTMIVSGTNTTNFSIGTNSKDSAALNKAETIISSGSSVIIDHFMRVDKVLRTSACSPFLAVADSTHDATSATIASHGTVSCVSSLPNDNIILPSISMGNNISKITPQSTNFDSSLVQQPLEDMGNIIEQYLYSQEGQKMLVDDFNTHSTCSTSAQPPPKPIPFNVDSNIKHRNATDLETSPNTASVVSHQLAELINDGSAICLNNFQASISTTLGGSNQRLNVFESNASTQAKNYLVLHVLPTSDTKLADKLASNSGKLTYLIPIVANTNVKATTATVQLAGHEKSNREIAASGRDILQIAYDDACKPAATKFCTVKNAPSILTNATTTTKTTGNYALLKQMLAKPCLPVATFECEICHLKLAKMERLTHLKSHNRTLYKCTYCHEIYVQQSSLIEHMKTHSQLQPKTYDCEMCEKSFANVLLYRLHTLVHKGLLFICVSCVKLFNKREEYEAHLKSHQSNSLTCDGCKRNFLNAVNGSNMIRCFTCIECISSKTASAAGQSNMTTKRAQFHLTRPDQSQIFDSENKFIEELSYECRYCNRICDGTANFRAHYDRHISTGVKCYLCHLSFDKFVTLEAHLNMHNSIRSIECPSCLNLFENRDSFQKHSHADYKPHLCGFCDQSFARKCDLVRHWNGHVTNVEYICNFCGVKFVFDNWESILTHKTSHQKAPIVECDDCDVKFTSAFELQNHRLAIHIQKPIPNELTNYETKNMAKLSCEFCGSSSFTEFNDLLTHLIKYHPNSEFKCFKCSCCGRFFTTESHWLEHKESDKSTLLPYSLKQFGNRLFKLEPDRKIAYNGNRCSKMLLQKNDVLRNT